MANIAQNVPQASKPLNAKVQYYSKGQYDAASVGGTQRPVSGQVWPRGNQ